MRDRRWLKLIKDYDCTLNYHPRIVNVVADALIRKTNDKMVNALTSQYYVLEDARKLDLEAVLGDTTSVLAAFTIQPTIFEEAKVAQPANHYLQKVKKEVQAKEMTDFMISVLFRNFLTRIWKVLARLNL
ncbi:hypothetical protein NE237_027127 [Protea cynaroides]|uniref:Uncharacterized protein n=1 Tax=Protea cynaroides TaxID=273540 RepID=A0A9Q0GMT8_9MAGN|nr:hypothetical protein NE237_027127 [Protea cynaroides]